MSFGAPTAPATLTIAHSGQRIHKPFIRHRFYTTPLRVSRGLACKPVYPGGIVRRDRRRTIWFRSIAKHALDPLRSEPHIGDIAPPHGGPPTPVPDSFENLV